MRALERYRSERKMGWSRPQNKVGVTTYRSYVLSFPDDDDLIGDGLACVRAELPGLEQEQARFIADLVDDPKLMGFVFCQDVVDEGVRYETVTLSLGRVSKLSKRHRDRFDIILDAEVRNGRRVEELTRLRVYVDPYRPPIAKNPGESAEVSLPRSEEALVLLDALALLDACHRDDAAKLWEHWTSRYVEYFGPRPSPVAATLFPDAIDEVLRLSPAHAPSDTVRLAEEGR
jgi:hypothetical protein